MRHEPWAAPAHASYPMSPASESPLRAFEFDGVVRLTRIGSWYVAFTIAIGFAAINTGNNALYIGLTFMLGCLLLSGIASKGGLKHLSIELRDVDEAWAGRPVDGTLRVENDSRIWNVRDVIITSAELERPVVIPVIDKQRELQVPVAFLFSRRGIANLKSIDCYTRYPFGFFFKKRRLRLSGEIVVFPQLLGHAPERERFRPAPGSEMPSHRPGPGDEVHSLRDYVAGDSLRQVHWKKSASLGRWVIKQPELEAASAVHVAVDPYRPRHVREQEFEEMISAAATFIHDAVGRGLDVVLTLPRVTLRATEAQSAYAIFHALALIEATHEPIHQIVDRDTVVFTVSNAERQTA